MKRFQTLRRKLGAMIGGFEGGLSARRLKSFQPSRAHVNTLIQAAGADMTARARYLIRNNGYAAKNPGPEMLSAPASSRPRALPMRN